MRRKIFYILLLLAAFVFAGFWIFMPSGNVYSPNRVPDGYRAYKIGQSIDFSQSGNSLEFLPVDNVWGGQEETHRCINAKKANIKLFVQNFDGSDLRFNIDLYGIYAPTENCQNITVFANDTLLDTWCAPRHDVFSVIIPASVMPNGVLDVRLEIAKPYTSDIDHITRGAAVREITLEKVLGNQTKKKFSLWLQKKLWGGPVENPYNNNSEQKQAK